MDLQTGVVDGLTDDHGVALLGRVAKAVAAARDHRIPVIYVRLAFRVGTPDISARNRAFSALIGRGGFGDDDLATQICEMVAPVEQDVVVVKKRVSAFTGSDLDVVLRSMGITHVVLAGILTSGVVLFTLTQAADLDYAVTVLSDGCSDRDDEVHRVLCEKVFPSRAEVVSVGEWIASLN
ncbi:cysteine hydrolase [Frankia sp. CNm7]|uniref:Cysteine hydrolase n=2 Tax=Frankia nepalensis TaxID=1836974 RepID=A0A937R8E4_9ACTN|nr:cysteine hydrolase [Frankia nepalensis]MBL7516380.1 cysteine hydrolase [Frankia nepalensis]MBL7517879.1 cysteine hydrolase [Frankia nepalensis]MBL7625790.1 cysteine hydrolase [Frankia nepalensis]